MAAKPTGVYLMELRQHVAEHSSRRQRLPIDSWVFPEVQQVPILHRPNRLLKLTR